MNKSAKPGRKPITARTVSKAMGRNMGVKGPSGQKGKLPPRRVK
jgi:hypothetical protein